MDMGSGMGMGGDSSSGPLSPQGVNFSDPDAASNFLDEILDDDQLKIIGNDYARYFWYGIVVAIGIAAIFRKARWLLLATRLRAAAQTKDHPARPQNPLLRWFATITAISREATYLQWTPTQRFKWFRVPPMGTILLVLSYLAFVLALEFINNDVAGAQYWQARGVRAGWLAVAQMPLLILLAGKNNLIGLVTGVSHERLNVLHRWSARIMLLLAIFHFGYQSYGWQKYGLMQLEWSTDSCPPTGIAAFALLLWMNLSTLAPFRHWSYEFFVVQHLITFFGFIIAVMYHLPSTALWSRIYVYIPIALYILDRIVRSLNVAITGFGKSRASLSALPGGVTKIQLSSKAIKKWRPGAHVRIAIPQFGMLQSHPATIASTPGSHNGDLVFMLKSHKGFTNRIMTHANESATGLINSDKKETHLENNAQIVTYRAIVEGPYGGSQSDFAAFDSVCFIAGSTGITFNIALLLDIADRASSLGKRLPVRRVHLVWCVKDTTWASWASREIEAACEKLNGADIDVKISVYVTCADIFTEQSQDPKECGCTCEKSSLGPCCCVVVEDDEDAEKVEQDAIRPAATDAKQTKPAKVTENSVSSSSNSSLESTAQSGVKLSVMPCATFYSGRPCIPELLTELLDGADGESGVAVCGPIGLSSHVRNTVVRLSDQRAIHKGSGAQGCYLHVEAFS